MENEVKVDEVELTPEEKARRVEAFFAKKQRQVRGEEEAPTAATVRHADGTEERLEMGSVAGAGAMGAIEGAATGALKGAGRAVKAGVGGLIVDPLIGAAKLVGTPVRMLGWDGIHRLADAAEKGWNEWGSEALDHGYEDWGTKLGDAGAKITGIAGMLGGMMGPGALAKAPGLIGKAGKVYNAALPFIFGNSAAVDTYDRAMASGQSEGRALAEAATDGAINFLGFKLFANKSLNRMLKIPEMQGPMAERLTKEGIGKGIKGFGDLVKAVRNGSVSEILVNRAKGAVKASGIMGVQDFLSSVVKQYADESVKPVEEMSDEELAAAKGQIDAWEAEQAKAAAEGRDPDIELKPEWEKDVWDRLAVGLKAGLHGAGEGALMEGVMGGGELALSMKEAREQTAAAVRQLIATPKGRAFMAAQNADAMGVVEGVAREGGTLTKAQLDAAGLPPDMPMREVRRLAFELKRDGEMAERRAEMETEEYKKRAELAERLAAELEEGKELEFETEEQKAEAERALQERKERIDETLADEMVARGQGMADTLFGEEAGVLVRRGTAEERRAAAEGAVGKGADARTLKDAEGQVCGYWDRGRNEVVLFGNADAKTVAHELGWHATRQWAERNSPELLAKMNAYAQSCPPELRAEIEAAYPDFAKNPDALLDEIGAGRFEKEMGAKFGEMLERSQEAKSWWQGLKDMIAEAWRGMVKGLGDWKIGGLGDSRIDLKALEAMPPEEGMSWLADRMIEGKTLKGGEAAKNAKGAEAQSGEKPVKTVEVRNTGDGTLRFRIVRNGQKKTYKRPEEALREFIAELDGVEMDAEQQGIYDVATGGRKTTDIRKDDLGNLIKLHKGGRGKGAQKIINVHYAGKTGKVTAKEVINMGLVIREGTLTFDGTPEHPASRRYELLAEDGARLRVVVDLDKQGNEAVINLYSNREDGNPGHNASSGAETTSREEPANQAAEAAEDGHAALTGERSRTVLHSTAPGKGSSDGADYSTGGETAQGGAQIRPQIKGVFTGSAADYAHRNEKGEIEDGPSLKKIGTGEGSQVYGWGLYGSSVRGVAADYATADAGRKRGRRTYLVADVKYDGKPIREIDKLRSEHLGLIGKLEDYGSIDKVLEAYEFFDKRGKLRENEKRDYEFLKANKGHFSLEENKPLSEHIYEQTFFTDRAPGDESHLLKWYEPVTDKRLLKEINEELPKHGYATLDEANQSGEPYTGGEIYHTLAEALGSPKAASEWLAAHDIDGVKYPVDSYGGKTLKDGDEAGWNYVSFRDDNIRVDHKWTDGEVRYSRKLKEATEGLKGKKDMSKPENARALRNYVKVIEPAPMPERLKEGTPQAALKWFEENMVGKTFAFDIPGYGHREFTVKVGHIGKLVCKGGLKSDGTKIVKGRIAKAGGDIERAFEMVRRGEVSAKEVEGWDKARAKSLPLAPEVFKNFDFAIHEKGANGKDIIILAKKFRNRKGRPNVIVMMLADDNITMGPLSSHVSDLTLSWLKKKDLILTEGGEVYNGSANNSASRTPTSWDNAERNSQETARIIPQEGEAAQGGGAKQAKERKVTPEEDAAYEEAVKRGDMETVRRMEREVYERMGYSDDSGYQGTSAFNGPAPSRNAYFETKAERIEATKNGEMEDTTTLGDFRDGIDVNNLQFIVFDPRSERNADTKRQEAIRNIRGVLEDGKDTITMYRSVPADVKEGQFRNGDWITPSRAYAEENARIHGWEKSRIIEQEVSVEDVWWDGNDIAEWGFDDGRGSVYKNTAFNRKLLGPTYDEAGNLIPLSKRFNDWKQDIRYQRRTAEEPPAQELRRAEEEIERTERALKAVREGRVRVAAAGGEAGEASEPGAAAGAELLAAQRIAPSDDRSVANPVALPMSGLVGLYRALRSNPALPKVLIEAKRKGAAWVSRLTKGSDVELNPEAFGIIDETDRARIKEEMKSEGMFRDEDHVWNMKHSKKECEAERQLSEMRLEDRLRTLADRRSKGLEPGGNRVATNALAHEIGRLVMEMPMSEKLRSVAGKEGAAALKDLRTVGEGIVKELRKQIEEAGGDVEDPKLIGSALKQAVDAAAWWRGDMKGVEEYERIAREKGEEGLKAAEAEEARAKEALAKDAKGLAGELFGMFLAAPETLRERAPAAFRRIVDAMGANETLAAAYARIASADAPTEVMAKIREQWTHEAQVELRALEREIDAPLGTLWQRVKRRAILNLHSKEGAAVSIIDDALQERVAAAKRALKVAKRDGDKAEIARAETNLEAVRKEAKDQLIDLKMGVLKKQRGGGMEREYALNVANRVMGDIARDGVELEDLRTYMKAKWCIALQGRADSFGMSPQEANTVIEGLRTRLGEADFAKLESAQRRFGEERRRAILENPDVVAAFGPALVEAWKRNADYVRSERILSAQQVKEYKAAREEWLRKNPGQVDVLGDIELMVEMHRVRHGGSDGSVFAKPLEGSFKATGDPLAYTMMHDMHILQFARRNALVTQIADMARELKMEGFKEVSDANLGRALEGSKRYGSVAFMRNGERKLLIMPKVAAEGFKSMGEGDVAGLVKANRMVSAILTQYSPRFAWRNMFRNRQAVENNIPWMRESKLQTASRYFGLGPVAKLAEHLMERAVVRLPDSVVRNRAMSLVWGENTTMYWIGEATRIAKLMFDPKAIRSLAERADAAAADGDLAAAQAIMEEIAKARDMMRKPVFAGQWRMMTGQADRADLDAVFAALDMRTNFTGERFEGLRRAARAAKDLADTVRRFNTFEEARIKIVAELAAARARNNAAADGREFRYSQKEVDYLTATMAGSPRYEMRGRWMNVLEAIPFGPFANVGMKGAWRTVESMKTDPKAWWGKASHRIAGRMAEIALWGAGGYALVAAIARRMFGDDEEAQKAIDGFESFGKRMARARACISDYRLRNYDIVPLGLYGKWCSFGINMPRGDEDRMIMPLTDTVARYLLKGDAAKRAGLHDPIDGAYTPVEAGVATLMDSGLAPDIYRGSMIWNLGKDTLYAWLQNPYNTFTKRNTYGQAVWENRFGSWSQAKDFFVETMKQAWNDVGGQVVVPATTWDEDAGDVPDEGKWVMGMADPKDAAEMPVGGRTIFRALHYVPMASSMLSGMFYMNCDGDARIARRLEKLQAGEKAARDIVAMKCLRMQLKDMDVAVDYSKILDAAVAENGWDEMDRALIEQALVKKLKAAARKMGRENVPILDVFNKTVSERERVGMERYLSGIGWEVE